MLIVSSQRLLFGLFALVAAASTCECVAAKRVATNPLARTQTDPIRIGRRCCVLHLQPLLETAAAIIADGAHDHTVRIGFVDLIVEYGVGTFAAGSDTHTDV